MTHSSMNPTTRARLTLAARRYLDARPWKLVEAEYLFGIHDRVSGRFGCASILGGAGVEFGLNVLQGATGFALHEAIRDSEIDHSSVLARSHGVALSITDAVPASRRFQRIEQLVIDRSKVKVGSARGYLTGWRLVPGQPPRPLDSDEGLFLLSRCLEAVAELARSDRLGKDTARDGTRVLVWNVMEVDGKATLRKSYRRVDEVDVQHEPLILTPQDLARLRARPRHEGRYLLSVFCPAADVQGGIVWTALLTDEQGRPLHTEVRVTFSDAARTIFEAFVGERASTPGTAAGVSVPREMWTDSFPVYEAFKDTLAELEVRFLCTEEVPKLAQARQSLNAFLGQP